MTFYKEKLLRFRKSKKLSQTNFAEKLNVSRSYIAQVEGGVIEPSNGFLEKIVEVFDVNKKFFFTDDNKNLNIDLIEKNVHLISPLNAHLFNNTDLDYKHLAIYIEECWAKMEKYYQRLIDIKLMLNRQEDTDVESGLIEFIERFAEVKSQYYNSLTYYKSNITIYKDTPVIEFSKLNKKEIIECYTKAQSDLAMFEYVFFEYFRKFFNEYLKDRYKK